VALQTSALMVWIFNAIMYAVVVCLIMYYAIAPSFEDMGIYTAGTIVFTGLCMSLQAKVAFFHHQWAWPQILVMFISVFGMLLYFLMIAVGQDDYWGVAQWVYGKGLFWLIAMFFMPIVAVYVDWLGYYTKLLFWPTDEMLYREFEHAATFDDNAMLNCINGPGVHIRSSEKLSEQYGIELFYSGDKKEGSGVTDSEGKNVSKNIKSTAHL
jgi:hypothetical protein